MMSSSVIVPRPIESKTAAWIVWSSWVAELGHDLGNLVVAIAPLLEPFDDRGLRVGLRLGIGHGAILRAKDSIYPHSSRDGGGCKSLAGRPFGHGPGDYNAGLIHMPFSRQLPLILAQPFDGIDGFLPLGAGR